MRLWARPLLKTLIERKLNEIREAIEALEALHTEMQSLHARTLALEHKTPAELMKSGPPKLRDAVFGRREKPGSGESPKR